MKPSPEIVTLPARPHFRSWGDTLAFPLLFAVTGLPLVGVAIYQAAQPHPTEVGAACPLSLGLPLSLAFPIALIITLARRRQLDHDLRALEDRVDTYAAALDDPASRPQALYRLAQLCFLRASRRGAWFDVALWERATGDRCPRTVVTAEGIDLAQPADAVTEETDIDSEAGVSRGKLLRDSIVLLIAVAVGAGFLLSGEQEVAAAIGAGSLIGLVQLSRRAGWRPIAIRSTVVSPRGIEMGGLAGSRAFALADSMLFLYDRYEDRDSRDLRLAILLLRRDGAQRTIPLTGRDDPRIPGIIARWTAGAEGV